MDLATALLIVQLIAAVYVACWTVKQLSKATYRWWCRGEPFIFFDAKKQREDIKKELRMIRKGLNK